MHDSVPLSVLLDAVTPVPGRLGRPRQRPRKLHTDKAYDFARCRRACNMRHIQARIARHGVEDTQRLDVIAGRLKEPSPGWNRCVDSQHDMSGALTPTMRSLYWAAP